MDKSVVKQWDDQTPEEKAKIDREECKYHPIIFFKPSIISL